ncbi:unnamed protein product [Echinostoma caproni]|uniref:Reverse transcriptase domain-containing protein n=1 Tax=Echinostoma caproni TaxID=27848 RepID=A0A183AHT3_9TREM|nr:unnamed protein product [Echinostoma caproni]
MHKRYKVRSLSKSIRTELRRLDNKCSPGTGQALMRVSGVKPLHCSPAAVDIDGLNQSFSNGGTALTALPNECEINTTDPVSSVAHVDISQELARLNPHKSCGPDGVSPAVLKECAAFLFRVLSELFNDYVSAT